MRPGFYLPFLTCAIIASGAQAGPKFVDRAAHLPVAHVYDGGWAHFVGGGVAIFDCNNDARPDIFAAGGKNPASMLINSSGPDITFEPVDIGQLTDVTGAYPIEIDGDGHADLIILRNGPNLVWQGQGDCTFHDVTTDWNFPAGDAWSTAFSAMWMPGDSFPTLAVGNYVDADDPDGPFGTCDTNWLIRPDGRAFAPPTALDPGFCPLSMLFTDWRRTGQAMLRISNDRQYYVRDGYEQMWDLNPLREWGDADGWGPVQIWGMGIASRDLSGDGLPEVMLTSMGDQKLMTNSGTGFDIVPYSTGTFAQRPFVGDDGRPSTGWHAEFGDMDNDGRDDLFIAKGNVDQMPGMAMEDPNNLLMQQPDGTFVEMADQAGIASGARSRGAGLVDLNGDGRLDIVVLNRRAPLEIWQNTTEDAGHWVGINLRQNGGNTHAIGAIIELRTDQGLQTREVTIGGGHVSGQLGAAHFGLGAAKNAQVRVIWPDQTVGDWTLVSSGTQITLTKAR
ncbi:CRTAC1 family protein [Yoonia sp. SS1-5]|uniref:CRTAC1 family protein n=1 Tax=Yoonia rhodophyticola TaxID=3137370 RepID=A0AAN0NJ50_9RHOB